MKVAIQDLIELKDRITYHGNDYKQISTEGKILLAEYDNKYYIVDGHARVRKLREEGIREIEADVIHVNSYEEIVKKHVERNYRSIIDYITLAIVCKEYNLDYTRKDILDNLDIEALKELDQAIRKYEYRAKVEIPRLLIEAIAKVPIELQKDLIIVLKKNFRLVKEDLFMFVLSLDFLEIIREFLEAKNVVINRDGTVLEQKKEEEKPKEDKEGESKPNGEEEEEGAKPKEEEEEEEKEEEPEVGGKPSPKEEDRMLKQGDVLEFNSVAEAFTFIRTDLDRLPRFAYYELMLGYSSRDELAKDRPSRVKLVVE